MEAKLLEDVREAKKALLDEVNPAKKEELRMMWNEAKGELNWFRRQQVAEGEHPKQAARCDAQRAAAGASHNLTAREERLMEEARAMRLEAQAPGEQACQSACCTVVEKCEC